MSNVNIERELVPAKIEHIKVACSQGVADMIINLCCGGTQLSLDMSNFSSVWLTKNSVADLIAALGELQGQMEAS